MVRSSNSELDQVVDAGEFLFSVPETFERLNKKGIDTQVLQYQGQQVLVSAEFGPLVDNKPKRLGFLNYKVLHEGSVSDHAANIHSYNWLEGSRNNRKLTTIAAFFGNPRENENNLLVEIECPSDINCEANALDIIRSICFK